MSPLKYVVAGIVLVIGAAAWADSAGPTDYLQGLQSLEGRRWADAAAAFAKASSADDENADYHTGAAIAAMMGGNQQLAKQEFDRSLRLKPSDNEAQLWAAGFYRMIGDALKGSRIHPSSDYAGTVQEAAEKVGQLRYDTVSPDEAHRRRENLEAFAVRYAKGKEAGTPGLAKALWSQVQQEFAAGHYEAAERDLDTVAKAYPVDPAVRLMLAKIDLARGRLLAARNHVTAELSLKTDDGAGYALRAVVHARLGALARAKADMDLAAHYDAAAAQAGQRAYEEAVVACGPDPAGASIAGLWAALRKSVESGQSFEQQVAAGMALARAANAHRLWWDEWYQEHLRALEDDWRVHPADATRLDALANYLLTEADDPGEQLCPKGPYRAFRDAHPAEEIARAEQLYRQALKANPNDVTAMAGVAEILLRRGQYGDGETLVRQALKVDPRDPRVLVLLSEILDYAASLRSGSAADLRTARTWMSGSGPGYTVWTTRYPSEAERARADELDRIAQELWNQAHEQLVQAVQARTGTAEGFYYTGLLDARDDNMAAAIAAYQQAVKLEPACKRYCMGLIHAYAKTGDTQTAAVEQEKFFLQRQTTANVRFAYTWNDIDRTAYRSVGQDLEGAFALDPADIRNAAYRGALAHAQKQLPEAIVWYSVAQAMEEASLRLNGQSALPDDKTPLPAYAGALAMELDLRIGMRQRETRQTDAALATFARNIAREGRIPRDQWQQKWAEAVLPNPLDTKATEQLSIDFISAWSHLLEGNTLLALRRYDDALAQFSAVAQDPRKAGPMDTFLEEKAVIDPHWAAYADAMRLHWAKFDPNASRRPQWLARAATFRWLTGDEIRAIQEIQTNARQSEMDEQVRQDQERAIQNLPPAQREAARQWQKQVDQRQAQLRRGQPNVPQGAAPGWPTEPAGNDGR